MEKNAFEQLYAINVNDRTEKKNGLTYLSWAWAWGEVKKLFPDCTYTIYEWVNQMGCPQNYFHDGHTAWVKTGVTINGIEHIEELPVMDYKNKSIPIENITSFDVNKAIQRSLTKAVARHGLGLYIYAGEDLPEAEDQKPVTTAEEKPKTTRRTTKKKPDDNTPPELTPPTPDPTKLTPEQVQELCDLTTELTGAKRGVAEYLARQLKVKYLEDATVEMYEVTRDYLIKEIEHKKNETAKAEA